MLISDRYRCGGYSEIWTQSWSMRSSWSTCFLDLIFASDRIELSNKPYIDRQLCFPSFTFYNSFILSVYSLLYTNMKISPGIVIIFMYHIQHYLRDTLWWCHASDIK